MVTPPQSWQTSLALLPGSSRLSLTGTEGNQVGSSIRTSNNKQVSWPLPGCGPMMYSTFKNKNNETR